jgi:N-carbamoyl-L-amino-acid hydrolase
VAGAPARLPRTAHRLQASFAGHADHAGTTRRGERHDALAAAARLIVHGDDLAAEDMVFTAARIEVEPNAPTTVPSAVRLWLDARAPDPADVERWQAALEADAAAIAGRAGATVHLRTAAWSPGTTFPADVLAALRAGLDEPATRDLVCFAGHDAGVVAAERPAGMVLVRNPTGISHAPDEEVSLEDAAVGANALVAALERLL